MSQSIATEQKNILRAPVFIVGSGRSGTTWLQRLLIENPEITGGQESEFFLCFGGAVRSFELDEAASRKLGMSTYWSEEKLMAAIIDLWEQTFVSMLEMKPEARVLAEKTPSHAFYMDAIRKLFPEAKFIHIIRDSRSVVSSMVAAEKGWGKSWAPSSIKDASILWWRSVNTAKESAKNMSSKHYIEVHYEDLLENTEYELSKLYDYLKVDRNPGLLKTIVENQNIKKQKATGGTGFKDHKGNELKEPEGFFRKGQADSWKQELNVFQKLVVWRYTRKLMRECGYDWDGRIKIEKGS